MFEEKFNEKIDEKKSHDIPVFCVAGKIAAGKNFVCSILERHGFFCIDADSVIHEVIKEKQNEILSEFSVDAQREGISLQNADGSLNRRALGKLVFSKKEFLARQEKIVYPAFVERIEKTIARISFGTNFENEKNVSRGIVLNAAVLYKTPRLLEKCRAIFFVEAPAFIRFLRVRHRDRIPSREILKRFFSQRNLLLQYKKFSKSHGIKIIKIKNYGSGTENKIRAAVDLALQYSRQ